MRICKKVTYGGFGSETVVADLVLKMYLSAYLVLKLLSVPLEFVIVREARLVSLNPNDFSPPLVRADDGRGSGSR